MDWKEFLEPTVLKAVVMVVLSALIWFTPFFPVPNCIKLPSSDGSPSRCVTQHASLYNIFFGYSGLLYSLSRWLIMPVLDIIRNIVFLMLIFGAIYLLSCTVVALYKKLLVR